jgi:hypothetical protein
MRLDDVSFPVARNCLRPLVNQLIRVKFRVGRVNDDIRPGPSLRQPRPNLFGKA